MNYYPPPKWPALNYQKTKVEMAAVIEYLRSLSIDKEVKRSAYIIFRNESANGKSGINNNYGGFQADSGRWPVEYDDKIVGTVTKAENGTNKQRVFLAFGDFKSSIDMLIGRVHARGLYIGGYAHKIAKVHISAPGWLAIAYKREWVTGDANATISISEQRNFISMYNQATQLFT